MEQLIRQELEVNPLLELDEEVDIEQEELEAQSEEENEAVPEAIEALEELEFDKPDLNHQDQFDEAEAANHHAESDDVYCATPVGFFQPWFRTSQTDGAAGDRRSGSHDQRLADMLKEEGIDIARRTVAKYREQLNINSARYRKSI